MIIQVFFVDLSLSDINILYPSVSIVYNDTDIFLLFNWYICFVCISENLPYFAPIQLPWPGFSFLSVASDDNLNAHVFRVFGDRRAHFFFCRG